MTSATCLLCDCADATYPRGGVEVYKSPAQRFEHRRIENAGLRQFQLQLLRSQKDMNIDDLDMDFLNLSSNDSGELSDSPRSESPFSPPKKASQRPPVPPAGSPLKMNEENGSKDAKAEPDYVKRVRNAANLYEVLGLGEITYNATFEQIRKAYRKMLLKLHPDKRQAEKSKHDVEEHDNDPIFLKVQEAWFTLSDPNERNIYDSQLDFNDEIPDPDDEGDFFEIYAPVFRRNARFSARENVPGLGGPNDPWSKVEQFYTFWFSFESSREFPATEGHDLSQASCREERRWMQRQNEKEKENKKKAEMKRVMRLVKQAYKRDPRVIAHKQQQQKEEEEAKKRAAEKEEETKRKRQEELEAAAQRNEQNKKDQKLQKRRMRLQRSALRQLIHRAFAESGFMQTEAGKEELENFLKQFTSDSLDAALDFFGLDSDTVAQDKAVLDSVADSKVFEKFNEEINMWMNKSSLHSDPTVSENEAKEEIKPSNKTETAEPWTAEELSLLAKAVSKIPGGSRQRWEQVSEYIATASGGAYARSKNECVKKADELRQNRKKETTDNKQTSDPSKKVEKSETKNTEKPTSGQEDPPSNPSSVNSATSAAVEAAKKLHIWTPEQQEALEDGLRLFPPTVNMSKSDRWKEIASRVPGKSVKECVQRFKEIRQKLKADNAKATSG